MSNTSNWHDVHRCVGLASSQDAHSIFPYSTFHAELMIKRIGLETLKSCTQKREYYMICRTPPIMSGSILHLLRTLDYYYVDGTRYSIDIRLVPFHNRVFIFNHSLSPDIV